MKASLSKLLSLQNDLDNDLVNGVIDLETYNEEWQDILHSFGWTEEEYEFEIDRRWDYLMSEPRGTKRSLAN